jgi:3-O-methylgallate 3,4-dioxygenase
MAKLEFGFGTAHGSQVSLPPDMWSVHAALDEQRTNFEELLAVHGDSLASVVTPEVFATKHARVQTAITRLRDALTSAAPDVIVIIGDDQKELFLDDCLPAMAVFWGKEIWDLPPDLEAMAPSHRAAAWAFHASEAEAYPTHAELGRVIIERSVAAGFDVAQLTRQPKGRSLGHAYTFIKRRVMNGAHTPMVPIFLNTYVPPNQPTVTRCIDFGRALGQAILDWECDLRVAVAASGGLSHFVIDEALDTTVIEGLRTGDFDSLRRIPSDAMASGTSEILNWLVAGAALDVAGLTMELVDYIPGYRSLAGTGVGMTFSLWEP